MTCPTSPPYPVTQKQTHHRAASGFVSAPALRSIAPTRAATLSAAAISPSPVSDTVVFFYPPFPPLACLRNSGEMLTLLSPVAICRNTSCVTAPTSTFAPCF